jgi:hypothetical protein
VTASSLSAVVTALVAGISGVPACEGAAVTDGFPAAVTSFMVVVGTFGEEGEAASGSEEWAGLGAQRRDEDYTITSEIWVSSGSARDQRAVRDKAMAAYAGISAWVRSDPSLGGLVGPRPAELTTWRLEQTGRDQAGGGRFARLLFGLRVRNRI